MLRTNRIHYSAKAVMAIRATLRLIKCYVCGTICKPPKGHGYIDAGQTVAAADKERHSVCDYVERLWDQIGHTQKVIDWFAAERVFERAHLTILEIGARTGRYLDRTLKTLKTLSRFESYEPDLG